ncbi:MAG: PEGA domain-containing protein [Spirochaetota bacterium]
MNRVWFYIIMFIYIGISGLPCIAGELYINTHPVGADVSINGQNVGKTPLRLKQMRQSHIQLDIHKQGYIPVKERVGLEDKRIQRVFYQLSHQNIALVLNQKNKHVYINRTRVGETPIIIRNVPDGVYQMNSIDQNIFISSSNKGLRRSTATETLFTAGLFLASIGALHYSNQQGNAADAYAMSFSSLIFGSLLGYNLLKLGKINSEMEQQHISMTGLKVEPYTGENDEEIFSSAMELLGKEQWEQAASKLRRLIGEYPNSQYVPIGTYKLGGCYYQMDQPSRALDYYREFVHQYPVYELFGYGVYYLIDLSLEMENPQLALAHYENLKPVFLDDASGQIYNMYYKVLEKLYVQTGSKNDYLLEDLLRELEAFLDKYRDSPAYSSVYKLKAELLYHYLDREKGLRMLRELEQTYKNITDSTLNAG